MRLEITYLDSIHDLNTEIHEIQYEFDKRESPYIRYTTNCGNVHSRRMSRIKSMKITDLTNLPDEYNHMLDIAFTIETEESDWTKLTPNKLIAALQERIDYLKGHPEEVRSSIGHNDSYTILRRKEHED